MTSPSATTANLVAFCAACPPLYNVNTSNTSATSCSSSSSVTTLSPRRSREVSTLRRRRYFHQHQRRQLCVTNTTTITRCITSNDDLTMNEALPPRPNVTKLKSQRSVLSCDKRDVTAEEINALMVKAGKAARDIEKWKRAIKGSYAVVSARLVSGGNLVGFARATSDHALNGTIWDVVTDPSLPDEDLMKRNVVKYLLKEVRRTVPGCSIALFSSVDDRKLFEGLDFVADPDGIRGMALFDPTEESFL